MLDGGSCRQKPGPSDQGRSDEGPVKLLRNPDPPPLTSQRSRGGLVHIPVCLEAPEINTVTHLEEPLTHRDPVWRGNKEESPKNQILRDTRGQRTDEPRTTDVTYRMIRPRTFSSSLVCWFFICSCWSDRDGSSTNQGETFHPTSDQLHLLKSTQICGNESLI